MINIREYEDRDSEGVKDCIIELQDFERVFEPDLRPEGNKIADDYLKYAVDRVKENDGKIFVAESDHNIIGFVSVIVNKEDSPAYPKDKYGYIMDLVTLSTSRKSGIGEMLLKKAEEFLKENGIHRLDLHVFSKNNTAGDFYIKRGFREIDKGMTKIID